MIRKTGLVISAVAVLFVASLFSQIYIPDNFEKPFTFRIYASIMKLASIGVELGNKFFS